MNDHAWPSDQAEHVWGPWQAQYGPPHSKFTQYRTCIHPTCRAFEEREAPRV